MKPTRKELQIIYARNARNHKKAFLSWLSAALKKDWGNRCSEYSKGCPFDPIEQILMDFFADCSAANPDGKTEIIRYGEWARKIREAFAAEEKLKELL